MTNTLLAHIVDYHHCSQTPSPMVNLIEQFASPSEKEILLRITKECILSATLLPIFSVGVQVSNAGHFVCHLISSYLLIPSLSNLSFSSLHVLIFLPSFLLLFLLLLFQSLLPVCSCLPLLSNSLLSLSFSFLIPSSSLHALAFLIRSFLSLSKLCSFMFLSSSFIWPLPSPRVTVGATTTWQRCLQMMRFLGTR